MIKEQELQQETLLKFIYQTPLGLAQFSDDGTINLLNATGVALFYQFYPELTHSNVYSLLQDDIPELKNQITSESGRPAPVEKIIRKIFNREDFYLKIKAIKLYQSTNMLIVDDITSEKRKETALADVNQKMAVEKGKLEVSSGILHDIGNGISGIKASLSKHLEHPEWDELNSFRKLIRYLEEEADSIGAAIGEKKGPALFKFMNEILKTMDSRRNSWTEQVSYLSSGIEHIEQILKIQKNYVGNFRSDSFGDLQIDLLIYDAIRMSSPITKGAGVSVSHHFDAHIHWKILGNPTKMMQVFLNLIKNSCEAMERTAEKRLKISGKRIHNGIEIYLDDSGDGLKSTDPFPPGYTSKNSGSGLGLSMVKNIISAHHGEISIVNKKESQGCLTTITFPQKEEPDG